MIALYAGKRRRARFAPEVVQTSAMDCGPAALKCLLEAHGLPVSYGRLREACQTSVDGTSIDTIEDVAVRLGLHAEQVLVPRDFICLDVPSSFPALVVVRHAEHFTHFVVVWSRHGNWLQIMDPAVGRRWVRADDFAEDIYPHEQSADARDWRGWCDSDAFRLPLLRRLTRLGLRTAEAEALLAEAHGDTGWFACGALDASVRLCASLVAAGGLRKGREAAQVLQALYRNTTSSGHDIFAVIPPDYWSVRPDLANTDPAREMLVVLGGVMLRTGEQPLLAAPTDRDLEPELFHAFHDTEPRPLRLAWAWLREQGHLRPAPLVGAMLLHALVLLSQALLMRALLDLAQSFTLPLQRVVGLGLLVLVVLMGAVIDFAMAGQAIRLGRSLETLLRRAILAKLPRLHDRYFQSRPITDMADRNHGLHAVRDLPALVLGGVQGVTDLLVTLCAVIWLAPEGWPLALGTLAVALVVPLVMQGGLNERDLRVRNHGAALYGFYLDALMALVPIRSHRAQHAVAMRHEGLLVEWARAMRAQARWTLTAEGVQVFLTTALTGSLIFRHFAQGAAASGTDLLLVFWVLRLPQAADQVGGLARSYPAIRNALLRQMEPLLAPEEERPLHTRTDAISPAAAAIRITGGRLLAGGHEILRGIDLAIQPGEHVAIVGKSGAGKSSLLGLLLGWHKLAEGELLVDGEPLGPDALAALRKDTAWVDPQVQIWNRSLLDNLTYAVEERDFTRVRELLEASGLMGISSRLPNGLQSPLGEGGGLLSGGEGQRVRLGRALLSDGARLALLDEPFRGLDRQQRRDLLASARTWWADATLLCVTHDIGETQGFDRVLVIEDGRIIEDGRPAELMRQPGRYRALCEAETAVLRGMWSAAGWRRWRVGNGRIGEGIAA